MFTETVASFCRSNEFSNNDQHIDLNNLSNDNYYTRYKILLYGKELNGVKDKPPLDLIKILDLSGDVDQFVPKNQIQTDGVVENGENVGEPDVSKKSPEKETLTFEFKPIQNCFKKKNNESSQEEVAETVDNSRFWGKFNGNLDGLFSKKKYKSSQNNGLIYLTVGPYVLLGKEVETKEGENLVILRKVPDHCSCVCSDSNTHYNHIAYYEICGVMNRKLEFKDRPIIYHTSNDDQLDEYYICPSNFINSDWFILRVNDEILNDMLDEQAYFKIINNESNKNKKAVLCILNNTYYIERIELGGTILLMFPLSEIEVKIEEDNLLVIIGSSKYAYNLIKCNPIFENLPKMSNIHISSLFDQTPISDLEISDYIMGKYEMFPSYYLYQLDGTLRYMGQYFFGEFAIRILQIIPIYFSNYPTNKKNLSLLNVGDMWDMINKYKDIFDFIPSELYNVSMLFQMLLKISDIDQTFVSIEDCLTVIKTDLVYNFNIKLNLFKIQKLISWCIVSANFHNEINYYQYTYYLDDILFNKTVPSYLFDDLIGYLANLGTDNEEILDYRKCIEYYYKNLSFGEVSNLFSHLKANQSQGNRRNTIFDKSGTELFIMDDLDIIYPDLYKLPCLNYNIFKLNTKGFTSLRFSFSMNSLLYICRSPLSLHVSFLSERMVCVLESNKCILKIYPMIRPEGLRDTLSELFKLKNRWHLEVLENKLKHFFKDRPAIDVLTGAPEYHGRLWIQKEKNTRNFFNENVVKEIKHETIDRWKKMKAELKPIKEESYKIINWNVPT